MRARNWAIGLLVSASVGLGCGPSPSDSTPGAHPSDEPPARSTTPDPAGGWFLVGSGDLARLDADRCLYERPDDDQFYVRFRVESLAEQDVGVDVRDPDLAPYPNQWGALPEPERTVINERRLSLEDRKTALSKKAVEGLHAGKLQELQSGEAFEFYRPFNAGGVEAIKQLEGPQARHLFVSFDGVLPVAASTVAELIPIETSLIVPVPVCWAAVPEDALIIPH